MWNYFHLQPPFTWSKLWIRLRGIKDLTASMGGWHPRRVGISQDNRALMVAWRLSPRIDGREEVTDPSSRLTFLPCTRQSINP
jgi:hypothetical protein